MSDTPIPASRVLLRAAEILEQRGWTQADGWNPQHLPDAAPLCMEGAGKAACMDLADTWDWYAAWYGPDFEGQTSGLGALAAIRDYLGMTPFAWNDAQGRTLEEVTAALRAAALIEAAREDTAVEARLPGNPRPRPTTDDRAAVAR